MTGRPRGRELVRRVALPAGSALIHFGRDEDGLWLRAEAIVAAEQYVGDFEGAVYIGPDALPANAEHEIGVVVPLLGAWQLTTYDRSIVLQPGGLQDVLDQIRAIPGLVSECLPSRLGLRDAG